MNAAAERRKLQDRAYSSTARWRQAIIRVKTTMKKDVEAIRKFWDRRAAEFGADSSATLREHYLRALEIWTMLKKIKKFGPRNVLDVGCGNGYSTRIYAAELKGTEFVGMDFSAEMIKAAREANSLDNLRFQTGDISDISTFPEGRFDLIISQRALQNLVSYEDQKRGIENLLRKKTKDGILLLMECSKPGLERLQKWRKRLGMAEAENVEPWHNHFLRDDYMKRDFDAEIHHFASTYMAATWLVSPRLQRIASRLPTVGRFGYEKLFVIH
jgi:ubiquinone/menaquinone biosynthesis C-methylase UbiE